MTTLVNVCSHCRAPLQMRPDTAGWCHTGGGVYILRCNTCAVFYDGPVRFRCKLCGGDLVNDHCAQPVAVRLVEV